MKKYLAIVFAILLTTALFAQRQTIDVQTQTTTAATKAVAESEPQADLIQGHIVSLKGLVLGTSGKVSKDEAIKLASKGDPLVFMYNGKAYLPFHENGAFAYDKVAEFANRTNVGIVGKTQSKNGVHSIIISRIVSLD